MDGKAISAAAGDTAADPGPLAKDLSPALQRPEIREAMRKVADWEAGHAEGKYNQDWTYAPLFLGYLAASKTLGDAKYHDIALREAEQFQWKLWANRAFHADDEAIGQTYEALYAEKRDPGRIADTRATFDRLVERPDDPGKDLWWWCDALFMAPAGMARMSAITHDRKYLEKMDAEWTLTTAHLYDPAQHLYSRDATFLQSKEANGQKLFWARGNGWVLAGLANTLRVLPGNDPLRPKYVSLYKDMAQRIAGLQQKDGLWRTGLLDPEAYTQPEVSGSAFFTYGLAWGVNEGLLDRATYQPMVQRAWAGLLQHIYADGRLGSIQPIGAAPGAFAPGSSYVYGVGAFLSAGSELDRMAGGSRPATAGKRK